MQVDFGKSQADRLRVFYDTLVLYIVIAKPNIICLERVFCPTLSKATVSGETPALTSMLPITDSGSVVVYLCAEPSVEVRSARFYPHRPDGMLRYYGCHS